MSNKQAEARQAQQNQMAEQQQQQQKGQQGPQQDDEPDEWDKRIFSTGCAGKSSSQRSQFHNDENLKLTDCYYDKKDWRECKDDMENFKRCWQAQGNDKRTAMKNT
ncbi:hypothetical protein B0T25DRAFT_572252 [Lasiosphaeria hispida]|uniref:CHCH domain-containing protein n=1 Tax=Lasiosphaeria hispida TaxID=260671 RepID=A0AAJ0MBC0_9PEZI|nr:hypothetical protein B0T25DRAFT_572252 [Lasiosphaeria hispida]